jgi:hypothetical protein
LIQIRKVRLDLEADLPSGIVLKVALHMNPAAAGPLSISRLWSSSLLLINRWAIQVPVSRGSATRSPLQWPMACSISASSRPMLRTIASVLSRVVAWGDTQVQARLILEHVARQSISPDMNLSYQRNL